MTRYRIEGPLGEGAMGTVHRAFDELKQRPVAIKILKGSASDNAQKRFLREARIASGISHPNIVAVLDALQGPDGRVQLVMELIEGESLETIMERGSVAAPRLMEMLAQVSRGIHHAHENGIIHRDLKPANIMVAKSGTPKVADFGLAHLTEGESLLTRTGASIGTPLYMSPEQAQGLNKLIDGRSDVYSLGILLYEIATGRLPFEGETVMDIYTKIINHEPPRPRGIKPSIPPDLEKIILKAIQKDPAKRQKSANEFADDLELHLAGLRPAEGASATQAGRSVPHAPRLERPPAKRSSPIAWIAGAVAVAGVVVLALMMNRPEPKVEPVAKPSKSPSPVAMVAPLTPDEQAQAAWADLVKGALPALMALEDHWFNDAPSPPKEAVARFDETIRATELKYPAAASPKAWSQVKEIYIVRRADFESIDRALEVSATDPYPALLKAQVFVMLYMAAFPGPGWTSNGTSITLLEVPDFPQIIRFVRKARECLDLAKSHPLFSRLAEGGVISTLVTASEILTKKPEEVLRMLPADARQSPAANTMELLRAQAMYLMNRFEEAAIRFDAYSSRRWGEIYMFSVRAWLLAGMNAGFSDPRSVGWFTKSVEWCDLREQRRLGIDHIFYFDRALAEGYAASSLRTQGKDASTWAGRAIEDYVKTIRLGSPNMYAPVHLGQLYLDAGRWDDVIKTAEAALKRSGEQWEYYMHGGIALYRLERFGESVTWFEKGVALNPSHPGLKGNLEAARTKVPK